MKPSGGRFGVCIKFVVYLHLHSHWSTEALHIWTRPHLVTDARWSHDLRSLYRCMCECGVRVVGKNKRHSVRGSSAAGREHVHLREQVDRHNLTGTLQELNAALSSTEVSRKASPRARENKRKIWRKNLIFWQEKLSLLYFSVKI